MYTEYTKLLNTILTCIGCRKMKTADVHVSLDHQMSLIMIIIVLYYAWKHKSYPKMNQLSCQVCCIF